MAGAREERQPPLVEVRDSQVHGLGAFAARRIGKGTRVIEYVGERVSHEEADRRYDDKNANDNHTFLFIVDSKTVIDAGVDGNEARFLNHSCDPNCESVIENKRVYIEAIRAIEPGEELTYDYQIQRENDDPPDIDEIFACRCGSAQCRGTMLWPRKRPERRRAAVNEPGRKARTKAGKKKSAAAKKSVRRR
jgi:SET domain-containing protein